MSACGSTGLDRLSASAKDWLTRHSVYVSMNIARARECGVYAG